MRSNVHTHSVYCDGKDTLEDLVRKALSLSFVSLGFSSHCKTGLREDKCGMSEEGTKRYFAEIATLKERYGGRIRLYGGIEQEAEYPDLASGSDYSILSCHFFHTPEGLCNIDHTARELKRGISLVGGRKAFLEQYFSLLMEADRTVPYQIVAHFDLYTKFDETEHIFDDYIPPVVFDALDYFVRRGKIFELNTGAIARGYRTTPYPSLPLLKRLRELNAPLIITSDCHDSAYLDCQGEESRNLLLSLGFRSQMAITDGGFEEEAF